MKGKSIAVINIIAYILLMPAAIWFGPYLWPENTTEHYFALNGAGIALMNVFFLMEKNNGDN